MLIHLRNLLSGEEAIKYRQKLEGAKFEDGKATARGRAREIKNNLQLPPNDPLAQELEGYLRERLLSSEIFNNVTQPRRMLPLRFCKYEVGMEYGDHLDLPLMKAPSGAPLRTDISMTVFLTPLEEYEGGALVFQSDYGVKMIRGGAGDAVVYPSNTLHRVEPVTKGARMVAITWIESLVRDPTKRRVLFDLVDSIRKLEKRHGQSAETQSLRRTHYNLLRRWADA